MAGDWIPMRMDLAEDPAVIAICDATNLDEFGVVGRLHRVWGWFNSQSRDGHAPCVTEKWIDRLVGVTGFADAMLKAGWLERSDSGISLPNFDRWNSKSAKKRLLATRRKRHARVTQASRTKCDESVTREEKRRVKETPLPPSGFVRFWNTWPPSSRKGAKGKCEAVWKRAGLESQADEILKHVESMKRSADWQKEGGAFVPAPLVYLNQRRWEGATEQTSRFAGVLCG